MLLDRSVIQFLLALQGARPRTDLMLAGRDDQHPVLMPFDEAAARYLTRFGLIVKIAGQSVRLGQPEVLPPAVVEVTLPDLRTWFDQLSTAGDVDWTRYGYRLGVIRRYFAHYQPRQEGQQKRNS
jgi:hypothetical protein